MLTIVHTKKNPIHHLFLLTHPDLIFITTISWSSNMVTCKTPPYAVLSSQTVKLTVDSVERRAPMQFTYNQDPIIDNVQPLRSFVRLEFSLLRSPLPPAIAVATLPGLRQTFQQNTSFISKTVIQMIHNEFCYHL